MANEGKVIARASDGTFAGNMTLTDKQRAFVAAFTEIGGNATKAAEIAGYADPRSSGYQMMQLPHVLAAIRAEREREIMTKGAATAWATMQDLMTNPRYTGAVKFQAARWTLEAAGSGLEAQRAKLGLPSSDKPLSEMTLEELDAFIAAGKQAVNTLQERRERTIEGEIVPDARNNARNSDAEDAQVVDLPGWGGALSPPTQDGDAPGDAE